jgi:hypothetical protein
MVQSMKHNMAGVVLKEKLQKIKLKVKERSAK